MRSSACSLAVAVMSSVCGCDRGRLLPLPEGSVDGVESWISAVRSIGSDAWEVAAAPAGSVLRIDTDGEPAEVLRFGYPVPLATLGLTEGPVAVDAGCERSCALVAPTVGQRAILRERAWEDGAPLPPDLAGHLVFAEHERCSASCPSFEALAVSLPGTAQVAFVVEHDRESVLFGMTDGALERIDLDGRVSSMCQLTGVVPTDAARGIGGALWISATDGRLLRLDATQLSTSTECLVREILPSPDGTQVTRLVASPSAPAELFALTATGSFARHDGARWEVLGHLDGDPVRARVGDIEWLGPNRAAAVRDSLEVVEWRGGTLHRSRPFGNAGNAMHALAHGDGDELFVLISRLGVYRSQGSAWVLLFNSPLVGLETLTLWDGTLLLTAENALDNFHLALGACGLVSLRGESLRELATIGRRGVVVADTGIESTTENQLYVLRDQRSCRE